MIECEKCENYFHADDVSACPECGLELCEDCYNVHIIRCINGNCDFEDDDCDYEDTLPRVCPHCETKLEIDNSYKGEYIVSTLYCPNIECTCDYSREMDRVHEDDVDLNVYFEEKEDN